MSKFRLRMSRQRGEAIAKEFGFESFPIDPFLIAEAENIMVTAKPPDRKGVSGGIIFDNDNVGIFYATDIRSDGFQRFTVSHELGHYFLDGHPEEILQHSPMHFSRAGFSEGASSIEIEADHFASGLLMPTHLVRSHLLEEQIGMAGIQALADIAECSLTASAIRAAECSDYPIAVVVSQGEKICYAFFSESFKRLGKFSFPRKGALVRESATLNFNRNSENVVSRKSACAETDFSIWFDGSREIHLDEEIVGLGNYGHTLSVFSGEKLSLDPDNEEDDEEALTESWTPKFAYGR